MSYLKLQKKILLNPTNIMKVYLIYIAKFYIKVLLFLNLTKCEKIIVLLITKKMFYFLSLIKCELYSKTSKAIICTLPVQFLQLKWYISNARNKKRTPISLIITAQLSTITCIEQDSSIKLIGFQSFDHYNNTSNTCDNSQSFGNCILIVMFVFIHLCITMNC